MSDFTTDLRETLATLILEAAKPLVEQVVAKETEGLTLEQRVHRIEIQSQMAYDLTNSQGTVLGEEIRHTKEDLDNLETGLVSFIFAVVGHVLGRTFTPEDVEAVRRITNRMVEETVEAGGEFSPEDSGAFIANAIREFIVNGG